MLTVKNLTVAYADTPVFADVAVHFNAGKITGIIGPNGAGKSTLIKAILGLIKVQSGKVDFSGHTLKEVQQAIAYVEQRKDLDLTFPINVLDLVLTGTYGRLGLLKSPGKKERQAALEALEQVGLADFTKRQISQLSGGQLQRVFVARAIVQQADIMILDEPFVGIDMKSEQEIMAILNQWRDVNKVSNYFDELVVMNHGIIAEGPVEEVYTAQNIERAFSADLSNVLFATKEGASV